MEYLPNLETLSHWLLEYGSISLFLLLALGIVAIPIPDETLMVIAGTLMASGHLMITPTVLAAFGGSVCGITTSYVLGHTVGIYFIHKYGPWLGIKEKSLENVHVWFERYGKWTLFVGYFIPGVRHFSGFVAGESALEYKNFALFAYSGALLWVSTFLAFGYFFGNYCVNHCEELLHGSEHVIMTIAVMIACALAVVWIVRKRKKRRKLANENSKDKDESS